MRGAEQAAKIALSSRYSLEAEQLIAFAHEHELDGIEYTIQSEAKEDLDREFSNMQKLADSGIEIRYHFQFRKVEPAHKDPEFAAKSVTYYKDCIDAVNRLGGTHIIVHLCLGYRYKMEEMSFEHARESLKEIVAYAREKGVTVCLENLTFGYTNTPEQFLSLIQSSGASANIDIGHAIASPIVTEHKISVENFMEQMLPYTVSAHVYNIEVADEEKRRAYHVCPEKDEDIESRIKILENSNCSWWLIELGDPEEILKTKKIIESICSR